jgi:ferritin-like metal-binding protein YciE
MATMESMQDLLVDELKDIYSAEKQLVEALPKMAKGATSPALERALNEHLAETEGQVTRLERIFEAMGKRAAGKRCKGMEGLIEEGAEILEHEGDGSVLDAGIIGAAQKVEHYEISAYGTAITHAELLGQNDIVSLLKESLEEEKAADKTLTMIAEEEVNLQATTGEGGEGDGKRSRGRRQ